jgi:hypothetical protein
MVDITDTALPVRARTASDSAQRLYPGAIGELLARELLSWGEFGHRLGSHELVARLVDHLDELDAGRGSISPPPPAHREPRHVHSRPVAANVSPFTARLRHEDVRTVLYAALYARRSAHGPVGELVARELDTYLGTDMCLAPSALLRRVLDDLLTLPGAPRPQAGCAEPAGPVLMQPAA